MDELKTDSSQYAPDSPDTGEASHAVIDHDTKDHAEAATDDAADERISLQQIPSSSPQEPSFLPASGLAEVSAVAVTEDDHMQDVGSSDHAADIMAADSSDSDMHSKLSATLQQDSAATVAAADANDDGGLSAAEQQQGADDRQPDRSYFVDGLRAIDVEVDSGPGTACQLLRVTIDITPLQQNPKPFLGGYRHKQNGVIYHHACSQTPPQPKQQRGAKGTSAAAASLDRLEKLTRQTQTVKSATTSSQTVREVATQMARPGLELDAAGDRVLEPRPYIPAAVVEDWRVRAAQIIQRYTRGWIARRRTAVLREIKAERDDFLGTAAAERDSSAIANRMREVDRRTHPLTREDFELLSKELETWRQQQTAAIKAAAQEAASRGQEFDQQTALQLLLAKETRLLQTLDKLRLNAKHENKARHMEKALGTMSQPQTWTLSNGKKVMVHTPSTVRAAELQQLYRGLTLPNLTLDERLDVLLHVKWAVKEYDTPSTREIVELIDREADLLNRGRSPKTLDGLRRRISGQFLAFCRNPAFNPEAHKLQLVPGGPDEPESFEYVDESIGTDIAQ